MTISWKWLEHDQTGPSGQVPLLISDLEKFFSPDLPFHEPLFATLYLPIQTELVQAPINKVVVLTWIFNFVNYTMNQIATVWEL